MIICLKINNIVKQQLGIFSNTPLPLGQSAHIDSTVFSFNPVEIIVILRSLNWDFTAEYRKNTKTNFARLE